jgi:tRNA U34 5-methylaminomethyl-2-thiouridine-forming methyltransferase MnmC
VKRQIVTTADGSKTIQIIDWNEQYHSKHGALQEAYHVFIKMGFQFICKPELSILEIGFGTGLNAIITAIESKKANRKVHYTGVEAYPVSSNELELLNYSDLFKTEFKPLVNKIHQSTWESLQPIEPNFHLHKKKLFFQEIEDKSAYDLIYFDAFGARVQPELWDKNIMAKMYRALNSQGVLVTYSAKGSVRRALQEVGFQVERLAGPPGKREMLRAIKAC